MKLRKLKKKTEKKNGEIRTARELKIIATIDAKIKKNTNFHSSC